MTTSSWVEEFIARYEAQGMNMIDDLEADWARCTQKYDLRRPSQEGQVLSIVPLIYGATPAPSIQPLLLLAP